MQHNMLEAKNQLSRLVQAALDGEDVVIAKKGIPVVRLVKIGGAAPVRKPGAWKRLPKAAADWDSGRTNRAVARLLAGEELS